MSASETAAALCFSLGLELFHAEEKGFYHFSLAAMSEGAELLFGDVPTSFLPSCCNCV